MPSLPVMWQTLRRNWRTSVRREFLIVVERHPDGYIAYPLGITGVVLGQGDTFDEAMADVRSAIKSHLDTFGEAVIEEDSLILEAYVAPAAIEV